MASALRIRGISHHGNAETPLPAASFPPPTPDAPLPGPPGRSCRPGPLQPCTGHGHAAPAIAQAESDSSTTDVINLAAGIYSQSAGRRWPGRDPGPERERSRQDADDRGAGSNAIVHPAVERGFRNFEVIGKTGATVTVVFRDLTIRYGEATDGGAVGGTAALGGGILIDGGNVTLSNASVSGNRAAGASGGAAFGRLAGGNAEGGGIYVAAGALTALSSKIDGNSPMAAPAARGSEARSPVGASRTGRRVPTARRERTGHPGASGKSGAAGDPGGSGGSGLDGGAGGDAPDDGTGRPGRRWGRWQRGWNLCRGGHRHPDQHDTQ